MKKEHENSQESRRSESAGSHSHTSLALELIAAVYRQITAIRERGKTPTGVVLPKNLYSALQDYRATLGDAPEGLPDYLGKHELFGLPIYTDNVKNPQVLVRKRKPAAEG